MPPHTYKSEYPPDTQIDDGIRAFFENFYQTSDTPTPEAHEKYAAAFTRDAELVMISKVARGYEEILELRKGMWTAVHSRLHTPVKVYPFGSGAGVDEVMLYGSVGYVLKDGRKTDLEFAARAKLVKEGGEWKMSFYQVYLDSAAIANAK